MNELAQSYQRLGLETTATSSEVKKAYRSLAKQWHPDLFFNQANLLHEAQQKIQEINQAYAIIKNHIEEENCDRNSNSSHSNQADQVKNKSNNVSTRKNSAELHYQRGVAFAEANDLEKAILEFSQAINIDNNYIKAYQYRGFILSKLGYELRADADFQKVAFLKLTQTHQPNEKAYPKEKKSTSNNTQKTPNRNQSTSRHIKYWKCQRTLLAHQREVSAITFNNNNFTFVSAGHDGKIKLWETDTGQSIATLTDNSARINSLALSNNGKVLITA